MLVSDRLFPRSGEKSFLPFALDSDIASTYFYVVPQDYV